MHVYYDMIDIDRLDDFHIHGRENKLLTKSHIHYSAIVSTVHIECIGITRLWANYTS